MLSIDLNWWSQLEKLTTTLFELASSGYRTAALPVELSSQLGTPCSFYPQHIFLILSWEFLVRISRALKCIEYQKLWHLTFISLSCTCSKNLFTSHFPQGFCLKYFISPSFTSCVFCSHICYEFLLCHIFHRPDISSTLFHHLSHFVFSVAIYVNVVIRLLCS